MFQLNGGGTLTISNFAVQEFSTLYRSCGNCSTQYKRNDQPQHHRGDRTGPRRLVGININRGDARRCGTSRSSTTPARRSSPARSTTEQHGRRLRTGQQELSLLHLGHHLQVVPGRSSSPHGEGGRTERPGGRFARPSASGAAQPARAPPRPAPADSRCRRRAARCRASRRAGVRAAGRGRRAGAVRRRRRRSGGRPGGERRRCGRAGPGPWRPRRPGATACRPIHPRAGRGGPCSAGPPRSEVTGQRPESGWRGGARHPRGVRRAGGRSAGRAGSARSAGPRPVAVITTISQSPSHARVRGCTASSWRRWRRAAGR